MDLIRTADDTRRLTHAAELEAIQERIGALRAQYADSTLAFVALELAWQVVRVAWYAVKHERREHVDDLDGALRWFRE